MRKQWTKEEINEVIKMKKEGHKLYTIGVKFNKTPNAIRKLLLRHYSVYLNHYTQPSYDITFATSIDYNKAIQWGINKNLEFKTSNSPVANMMILNEYRKKSGLPPFQVRRRIF